MQTNTSKLLLLLFTYFYEGWLQNGTGTSFSLRWWEPVKTGIRRTTGYIRSHDTVVYILNRYNFRFLFVLATEYTAATVRFLRILFFSSIFMSRIHYTLNIMLNLIL